MCCFLKIPFLASLFYFCGFVLASPVPAAGVALSNLVETGMGVSKLEGSLATRQNLPSLNASLVDDNQNGSVNPNAVVIYHDPHGEFSVKFIPLPCTGLNVNAVLAESKGYQAVLDLALAYNGHYAFLEDTVEWSYNDAILHITTQGADERPLHIYDVAGLLRAITWLIVRTNQKINRVSFTMTRREGSKICLGEWGLPLQGAAASTSAANPDSSTATS